MRVGFSIGIILLLCFTALPALAAERVCFAPDGTQIDIEAYRQQTRRHHAEVARIRAQRRRAEVDAQGRPLVDARGNEIRYSRMAAFEIKPRRGFDNYGATAAPAAAREKKKFWKKAEKGKAFQVGKDPYKTRPNNGQGDLRPGVSARHANR